MYYTTGEKSKKYRQFIDVLFAKLKFYLRTFSHKPLDDSSFSKIKFDQEAKQTSKVLAGGISCVDHSLGFRINDQSQHQ